MDKMDKKILNVLQTNADVSNQTLADTVGLSPSPCLRRVKRLEDEGYIMAKVAKLDPKKLGLNLTAIVSVTLENHTTKVMQGFKEKMTALPEVTQCYLVTGQSADYILKVVSAGLPEYQTFLLDKLTKIPGVSIVHSSFVLEEICNTTALPLD